MFKVAVWTVIVAGVIIMFLVPGALRAGDRARRGVWMLLAAWAAVIVIIIVDVIMHPSLLNAFWLLGNP